MSIEAFKCTNVDCKGYMAIENADFDFRRAVNDDYTLDEAECEECGTKYKVAVHYAMIKVDDEGEWTGEYALESCMTKYEARQRELKNE